MDESDDLVREAALKARQDIERRLEQLEKQAFELEYLKGQKEQADIESLTVAEYTMFRDLLIKGVGRDAAMTFAKQYATDAPSQEEVDAAIASIRRAGQ